MNYQPNYFPLPMALDSVPVGLIKRRIEDMFGLDEKAQIFRSEMDSYIALLETQVDTLLKGNEKIQSKRALKILRKKIRGFSDDHIHGIILGRDHMDDIIKGGQHLYEDGVISKKTLKRTQYLLARGSYTPFHSIQQEFRTIETYIRIKQNSKSKLDIGKSIEPLPIDNSFRRVIESIRQSTLTGRSSEEKVGRMRVRVETILSKEPNPLLERELQEMIEKMDGLFAEDSLSEDLVRSTRELIKSAIIHCQKTPEIPVLNNNTPHLPLNQESILEITQEKREAIEYITFLFSKGLNYELSSTKGNGHKTHGDGSFVVKIFRPFLQALKNQILLNEKINVSDVSWSELVEVYEENIVDPDPARTHFLGILKKYQVKGFFLSIFAANIQDIISEFSRSNFYKDEKNALQNISDFFKQNPPPVR